MSLKTDTIFTYLFSLVWLMSLFIGFSFLNTSQIVKNADLVYCPLQKTWVKRDEAAQPIRQNPLDQICMSDQKRQELTLQITLKNAFAIDEKGIFDTLQKGEKVLSKYQENPNLPNQNLVQIRQTLNFLNNQNNWKVNFIAKSEAFSFALNSRPPTFLRSTKFDFQFAQTLDKISRNINPRSPPFSI